MRHRDRKDGIHRNRRVLSDGRVVWYHYAWRSGPRFWKTGDEAPEGGPAYWQAFAKAFEDHEPDAGRFRSILRRYLKSRAFLDLSERTQKDYRSSIFAAGGIDETFGTAPVRAFDQPRIRRFVYEWHDAMRSDRVADHRRTHLTTIVSWAVDRGVIQMHHLKGMKNRYSVDRSQIIWTDDEISLFIHGDPEAGIPAAPGYLARAIVAATETGMRPQDLIQLSKGHIQKTRAGRRIVFRTQKRNRMASIPVTPKMEAVIDGTPKDRLVILTGAKGRPFERANSLGRAFAKRRAECGIRDELRLYDCRGTAATRLFDANASLKEIALAMSWDVTYAARMIEIYCAMHPDASDGLLVKLARAE